MVKNGELIVNSMSLSRTLQGKTSQLLLSNYDAQISNIQAEYSLMKGALEQINACLTKFLDSKSATNKLITPQSHGGTAPVKTASDKDNLYKNYKVLWATGQTLNNGLRAETKRQSQYIDDLETKLRDQYDLEEYLSSTNQELGKKADDLEVQVKHNAVQLSWILPIVTQKTLLVEKHEATIKKHLSRMKVQDVLISSLCGDVAKRDQIIAIKEAEMKQMESEVDNTRLELYLKLEEKEQHIRDIKFHESVIHELKKPQKSANGNVCCHQDIFYTKYEQTKGSSLIAEDLEACLMSPLESFATSALVYQNMNEMSESMIRQRDHAIQSLEKDAVTPRNTAKILEYLSLDHKKIKENTDTANGSRWGEDDMVVVEDDNLKFEGGKADEDDDFVLIEGEEFDLDTDKYDCFILK